MAPTIDPHRYGSCCRFVTCFFRKLPKLSDDGGIWIYGCFNKLQVSQIIQTSTSLLYSTVVSNNVLVGFSIKQQKTHVGVSVNIHIPVLNVLPTSHKSHKSHNSHNSHKSHKSHIQRLWWSSPHGSAWAPGRCASRCKPPCSPRHRWHHPGEVPGGC